MSSPTHEPSHEPSHEERSQQLVHYRQPNLSIKRHFFSHEETCVMVGSLACLHCDRVMNASEIQWIYIPQLGNVYIPMCDAVQCPIK
jgi:hypothetical protein